MISTQNVETPTDIKSVGASVIVAHDKQYFTRHQKIALLAGRALFLKTPLAERNLKDMQNIPKIHPEIKASLEPTLLKNSIKKRRRELLAAPFSVSAYKLLLSLDLLLAEFEGGCR